MDTTARYGMYLKRINEALDRGANRNLQRRNLTRSQAHLLLALRRSDGHCGTLKELERVLHAAQSTVVGLVARAERKGLVETYPDRQDRRVKHVRLTENGARTADTCREEIIESNRSLALPLTEEEQEQFLGMLQRVCEHLEAAEKPAALHSVRGSVKACGPSLTSPMEL